MAQSGDTTTLERARTQRANLKSASALAFAPRGVLLVGDGEPYGAREVAKVLQIPVTASLALDQDAAAVFSRGANPPRRFESSQLLRGFRAASSAIQSVVSANRASLGAIPDVGSLA